LNKEIRRRTDVAGIFPDEPRSSASWDRCSSSSTEEWAEQRRYMSAEALARVHRVRFAHTDDGTEPAIAASLTA